MVLIVKTVIEETSLELEQVQLELRPPTSKTCARSEWGGAEVILVDGADQALADRVRSASPTARCCQSMMPAQKHSPSKIKDH